MQSGKERPAPLIALRPISVAAKLLVSDQGRRTPLVDIEYKQIFRIANRVSPTTGMKWIGGQLFGRMLDSARPQVDTGHIVPVSASPPTQRGQSHRTRQCFNRVPCHPQPIHCRPEHLPFALDEMHSGAPEQTMSENVRVRTAIWRRHQHHDMSQINHLVHPSSRVLFIFANQQDIVAPCYVSRRITVIRDCVARWLAAGPHLSGAAKPACDAPIGIAIRTICNRTFSGSATPLDRRLTREPVNL